MYCIFHTDLLRIFPLSIFAMSCFYLLDLPCILFSFQIYHVLYLPSRFTMNCIVFTFPVYQRLFLSARFTVHCIYSTYFYVLYSFQEYLPSGFILFYMALLDLPCDVFTIEIFQELISQIFHVLYSESRFMRFCMIFTDIRVCTIKADFLEENCPQA